MTNWRARVEWLLGRFWFRAGFAMLCIAMHVLSTRDMARERFQQPFNRVPDGAPMFHDAAHEHHVENGKRLAVARWDAEHYIALAIRGYEECPPAPMSDATIKKHDGTCTLTFYPGYSMIGRALVRMHKMPMDLALWYASLLATFLTFFLWTSRTMTDRFGASTAWLSLIILNFYPPACYLVFVATEPCTMLFTLGAYIAFARKHYALAGLLAGAASAMRVTGLAVGGALGLALIVATIEERPKGVFAWAERIVAVPLSVWGTAAVMGFFWWRFEDPLIYNRAHEVIYSHKPELSQLLDPKPAWIMHSIDGCVHDSVWAIGLLIWFLLGARLAFKRLRVSERWFLYALVAATYAMVIAGTLQIYLGGMSRYVLIAFPLFIAMAAILRTRPVVLLLWLAMSRWHYREVDLCYYVGDVGPYGLRKCNMTQWIDY